MSRLLKSSGVFALMTLLSRVLGLVRDVVIANYFSVAHTDVFFTALRIPNTLRRFFAEGGFANAFVPVLNETKEQKNDQELQSLINHVFGALGMFLLIITALGIVFAGSLIGLIGFGFEDASRKALGTLMLQITFPYILFISLTAFFAGILNAYQKFALPAFIPAMLNVSLIAGALLFREYFEPPALVLAWAVFIGGFIQFSIQLPTLWRIKRFPIPKISFAHRGVRKIGRLILPTLLGSSAGQISVLLNTALASTLTAGSITWLYYSDRLVELPVALIGVSLGVVILPRLSALKATSDTQTFSTTLTWAFYVAFLVGSAAATGLASLALPLMITLLQRGEFSQHSATMASQSLMVFSLGGLCWVLIKVLAPGFYSRQNTKTPAQVAIACIGVNICCALLLYKSLGHIGLALAATISACANCLSLIIILHRDGVLILGKRFAVFALQIICANSVMATCLYMANNYITSSVMWHELSLGWRFGALSLLIGVGAVSYYLSLLIVGVKPLSLLRSYEKRH